MKHPRSLRTRLLTGVLLCWLLPLLSVMALAGFLLGSSYERSSRRELASRASNALEQLDFRLEALFEDSKTVSYDGVVRNAYRLWQQDGDSAVLYRTTVEYLNLNFARNERVPAAFLSFWENRDIRPYAASRGDLGFNAQRVYREDIEPDVLEKMRDVDTGILLLEYGGELYIARNLLDSRLKPYATIVLLCDRGVLFQSLDQLRQISTISLLIDGTILLDEDGTLRAAETGAEESTTTEGALVFPMEAAGHSLKLTAVPAPFNVWREVPQIRTAAGLVALLVLPALTVVIWLFRRHVTKPMEILVAANNRLEEGERGYTIDAEANSEEFARLYAHFNTMSAELKNQFEHSYLEQQALQQAKIKALQSQINPHFLNNTLETINWEARLAGDERVSAMIEALATLMDAALGRDGRSQIPLREELNVVDAYLYIVRERLGERLIISKEIDPQMMDTAVPRLILQPLAENAVEHDLTPRRGGRLCLRASRETGPADRVVLEVEHDGCMSPEDLETIEKMLNATEDEPANSGHVGLRNVRQRLRLLYGDEGELSLNQLDGERILARVRFPTDRSSSGQKL